LIQQQVAEQRARGWTITFADGKLASVEVHALGEGPFGGMREECQKALQQEESREVKQAPYESYDKGGVVVACGREYEVAVSSGHYNKETRAALAAVALRALEG
jgi:hypothetical protein